jgi:hypothetical protein
VTTVPSFVVFQEDSSSQEKETKGTVWQLEQVFAYVVKSSSAVCVWQYAGPIVSVVLQDAEEYKKK